jgi:hypothetical protein
LSRIQLTTCARDFHQIPIGTAVCPWCVIDEERAARRQRQAWARPGTGPQKVLPRQTGPQPIASGPRTVRQPVARKDEPDKIFGMTSQTYLVVLLAVVLTVVALATFIVWAVLSGATTFGS